MDTLQRSKEQIQKALEFLAKAKFTIAKNLQDVVGRNRRGLPTQLVKKGLLVSRKMPTGQTIVGLSSKAAAMMGVKKIDIHKLSPLRVAHSLLVQTEIIALMGYVVDYQFEPQANSHDYRPDAGLQITSGLIVDIEAEISPKGIKNGEMDRFFLKNLDTHTNKTQKRVVFKEESMLECYLTHAKRYYQDGIPRWIKVNGEWMKLDKVVRFSDKQWSRVMFKMSNDFAIHSLLYLIRNKVDISACRLNSMPTDTMDLWLFDDE